LSSFQRVVFWAIGRATIPLPCTYVPASRISLSSNKQLTDPGPDIERFFRDKGRGPRPPLATANAATAQGPSATADSSGTSGIPGSVVTSTGYSHDANGHPARFTACDGQLAIPYLVDIDGSKLPAGMDPPAALAAVQEALNAWSAPSSARFQLVGTQSFGMAAGNVPANDRVLRIQLHDSYNFITLSGVLGVGGGNSSFESAVFNGGKIATQGFQERRSAYVVLNHRSSFMAQAANFKQVLTHELGHALGLAHSSENPSEPEPVLKGATMYYSAANDGRGATIKLYDQDRIVFGYPTVNRPPYTIDRLIPVITTSASYGTLPATPGCNQIRLKAIDAEGASLTPQLTASSSSAGSFSFSGTTLKFTPSGYYLDALLSTVQIFEGYQYGKAVVQFSDGTNLSRAAVCTVPAIYSDSTPADGLPDSWMTANFGSKSTGGPGSGRHPDDDPDKDGLSNRGEFYQGTDPKSANSGRLSPSFNASTRELVFTPQRFAPYFIEATPSLEGGTWIPRSVFTRFDETTTPASLPVTLGEAPAEFFRIVTGP
jgi:hypothetical protein